MNNEELDARMGENLLKMAREANKDEFSWRTSFYQDLVELDASTILINLKMGDMTTETNVLSSLQDFRAEYRYYSLMGGQ
jgi:hypothetical protein